LVRTPEIRASRLARLCIWVLVVPILFGVHYFRQKTTRRNADQIVHVAAEPGLAALLEP